MENIILLHGALGTSSDLANLKSVLQKQSFTVHSLNFSSHGSSQLKDGFGIDTFTGELNDYIEEKKIKFPILFGYSMGGYVALNLAIQKPGLIGAIVTLGTKLNWTKEFVTNEIKSLDAGFLLKQTPAFAASLMQKHGDNWTGLLKRTAGMMLEITANNEVFRSQLKTIDLPIMLMRAERDHMVSEEETTMVYKTLKNAAFFKLAGSKHALETVDHEKLANQIKTFIAGSVAGLNPV